jgi:hypothetical protein
MIYLLISLILFIPSTILAHPGAVDNYGCHNNTKLNVYECHGGQLSGKSFPNPNGKQAMLALLATVPPTPTLTITGTATLTWNANTESDLAGYKLYWRVKDGEWQEPIVVEKVTELKLDGILVGAIYEFTLTAFDTSGNESQRSNMVFKSFRKNP